jgi:predicted RNase H-like nuclease (RuvC/YqgF family)
VREDSEEAAVADDSPERITANQFKSIQSENEALKGETTRLNGEIQSLKEEIDSLSEMYDSAVNSALTSKLAVAKDEGSVELDNEKSELSAKIQLLEGRYEEAVAALKVSRNRVI